MRAAALFVVAGCNFSAALSPPAPGDPHDAPTGCFEARCRRKTITIDHTQVTGGPHVKFPVYIRIVDPELANQAPVAFTVDGMTALPFERDRIAADALEAWVAVPSLASTADTVIQLYYGDPVAGDDKPPTAVWDGGYQAVWHLSGSAATDTATDSTANANHGVPVSGPILGVEGMVGTAARFEGTDDHLVVPKSESLTSTAAQATLSMWVNWTNAASGTYQRLLMASNTFAGDSRGFEWGSDEQGFHYYYPSDAGGNNYNGVPNPFTNGKWHYLVVTHDFATKTVRFYVDGAQPPISIVNTPTLWMNLATAAEWYWGGGPTRANFVGRMDEIRVSSVLRSTGWIATELANQRAPATFYRVE